MISVTSQVTKVVQHLSHPQSPTTIPGLYSGIFAMYLEHHGSRQSIDKAKNILFYALWVLYALTVATIIVDILVCLELPDPVSIDDHGCLILFQLLDVQTIVYHFQIIGVTLFTCCDFIAQSILVRTTGNTYLFI